MKKLYVLVLLFLFIGLLAQAQNTFIKQLPLTNGKQVIATKDGGYLVAGSSYIIKYSALDNPIWTVRAGDTTKVTFGKVIPTSDNGYIVTANTRKDFDENHYVEICKVNATGKIIWQKAMYGYSVSDVAEDKAGNYLFAYNNLYNVFSAFLVKMDVNGNVIWNKKPYATAGSDTYISSIKITQDNNYAIAGGVEGYANLSVLDGSGNQILNKSFNYIAYPSVVDEFVNGDFLLVSSQVNYESNSSYVNRLTSNGDLVWHKEIKKKIGKVVDVFNAAVIADDHILLTGLRTNSIDFQDTVLTVASVQANGKLLWERAINTPVRAAGVSVARLKNGSFRVLATRFTYRSNISFIIRLSATGVTCDTTSLPATAVDNNISTLTYPDYTDYTLNTLPPVLTLSEAPNLTETIVCNPEASNITAASAKVVAAIADVNGIFTIAAYPNPAVSKVSLSIMMNKPDKVKAELTDLSGKTVLINSYQLPAGRSVKQMEVSALAKGVYLLKVSSSNAVTTIKLVKE